MLFTDTYRTITGEASASYREKASKFIGLAFPVSTEEDVKQELKLIKKEYFDASHHCYAFQLGFDKSSSRMNDDGEPSGTAGRPIFGQIQSFDLTNILLVVIRYFGGTKLGVSGLINAYKSTARETLLQAGIVEKTINDFYQVSYPYERMNDVMKMIKENNLTILSTDFNLKCQLIFCLRRRDAELIHGLFIKMPGLEIRYLKSQ